MPFQGGAQLPLSVDVDLENRKKKAAKEVEKEYNRQQAELKANNIFGKVLDECKWKPYGKVFSINYHRQFVSLNSRSALTARTMTTDHLSRLGWVFSRTQTFTSSSRNFWKRPTSPFLAELEAELRTLQKVLLPEGDIFFPPSMKLHSYPPQLNSSGEDVTTQLRRLSNGLYLMLEEGNFPDMNPASKSHMYPKSPSPSEGSDEVHAIPKLHWNVASPARPLHLALEITLASLLNINTLGSPSSELQVERTIGSVLQAAFQSIATPQNVEVTSNQPLLFYGALTAFGSHPEPDLLARAAAGCHFLFRPVCWIGEAKLHKEKNDDTIAQLATSAHSTLALLVLAWSIMQGDPRPNSPKPPTFPSWAFLIGMIYTEEEIEIHALYPFDGYSNSQSCWQYRSVLISTFHRIQNESPIYKLHFMYSLIKLRDHAEKFRLEMLKLLAAVFVFNHKTKKLEINPQVIKQNHHIYPQMLEKISSALGDSLKEWEMITGQATIPGST